MSSIPASVAAAALKRLETQHWPYHSFDGAMVLVDDVVEVFDLTDFDACRMDRSMVLSAIGPFGWVE